MSDDYARLSRLHEEATERLAKVRIAVERADARMLNEERPLSVLVDLYSEITLIVGGRRDYSY